MFKKTNEHRFLLNWTVEPTLINNLYHEIMREMEWKAVKLLDEVLYHEHMENGGVQ